MQGLTVKSDARADVSSVLAGGSLSVFALPEPVVINRGAGAAVWDVRGQQYTDFLLGSGPLILGHAHPEVTAAVRDQVTRGTTYYALNEPAVALAGILAAMPGCVERVRFVSTGTEATLHALRVARGHTRRPKVMVFAGGYHGSHEVSIVAFRGRENAALGGVTNGVSCDVLIANFNDTASVDDLFAAHGESLAAVLVEPQQRTVDPAPGFLEGLRSRCDEFGTVLIFDEVLTGFRSAFGGAQEYYGVEPDLVCYGKILGGGFPLAALAGRADLMEIVDSRRGPDFVHVSGTLSGNPVSARAGLATLAVLMRQGAYETLHALGKRLRAGLDRVVQSNGFDAKVVGSGPLAAIQLGPTYSHVQGRELRRRLTAELLRRGVLVQIETRWYVSLVHTGAMIDDAVCAFDESLGVAVDRCVGKSA